jgi:hypothetical protein
VSNIPFAVATTITNSDGTVTVAGTAPLEAKTVQFNGVEWPLTWTSVSAWRATVPLHGGTNYLTAAGVDLHGQPVSGASSTFTVFNAASASSPDAISYDSVGLVYQQEFDSLPEPGLNSINADNPVVINGVTYALSNPFGFALPAMATSPGGGLDLALMAGWFGMAQQSSSTVAKFGATFGDQTTGGDISFGLPGSTNRALGLLATKSTGPTAFGAKLINNTGKTLRSVSIQFTGELWRQSDTPKTLQFSYYIDPTATNAFSTNVTASIPALNVSFATSLLAAGGVAVDGTASSNQVQLAVQNQPISDWPPGAALWLTWEMVDSTGKAQGLGIDHLRFSASDQSTAPGGVSLTAQIIGSQLVLAWPSVQGQSYQLQATTDLIGGQWNSIGNPTAGTGALLTQSTSLSGAAQQFFRLQILP